MKKYSDETYVNEIFQKLYPIGSIYLSTVSTNPNTLFGFGTWERIQDRFLLAAGSSYSAGSTGGSGSHTHTSAAHTHTIAGHTHTSAAHTHTTAEHTLTISEMPVHSHQSLYHNPTTPSHSWGFNYADYGSLSSSTDLLNSGIQSTGGGNAHSHGDTGSTTPGSTGSTSLTTNSTTPGSTGSSSNLPPYLSIYVWKRVS